NNNAPGPSFPSSLTLSANVDRDQEPPVQAIHDIQNQEGIAYPKAVDQDNGGDDLDGEPLDTELDSTPPIPLPV
ncbi:hypothetical protein FRB90_010064, partial [Tulasnella sp. 427]